MRRILALLALAASAHGAAKKDPKECEVCIANLEAIDALIDKDEKTSKQSIMEGITKHCGDLQNEAPNPNLNSRDRKMCYYFEPIRAAIAQYGHVLDGGSAQAKNDLLVAKQYAACSLSLIHI